MQNPPRDERSQLRRIADLEQRIRVLETSPRAGLVLSFADGAAILAGIPTPTEGTLAYEELGDTYWTYTNGAWTRLVSAGSWLAYTPTWTSSGTAPALGNGSAVGQYTQSAKMITFYASITMGSTTTFGTGAYSIGLPVSGAVTTPTQNVLCRCSEASPSGNYSGIASLSSGATAVLIVGVSGAGGALANATSTVPIAWTTSDVMSVWGTYEIA